MTSRRNFGPIGASRHESPLPMTIDRRTRRRLLLIGGMFCLAFAALAVVIALKLAGVVE